MWPYKSLKSGVVRWQKLQFSDRPCRLSLPTELLQTVANFDRGPQDFNFASIFCQNRGFFQFSASNFAFLDEFFLDRKIF